MRGSDLHGTGKAAAPGCSNTRLPCQNVLPTATRTLFRSQARITQKQSQSSTTSLVFLVKDRQSNQQPISRERETNSECRTSLISRHGTCWVNGFDEQSQDKNELCFQLGHWLSSKVRWHVLDSDAQHPYDMQMLKSAIGIKHRWLLIQVKERTEANDARRPIPAFGTTTFTYVVL